MSVGLTSCFGGDLLDDAVADCTGAWDLPVIFLELFLSTDSSSVKRELAFTQSTWTFVSVTNPQEEHLKFNSSSHNSQYENGSIDDPHLIQVVEPTATFYQASD